jgi:hypothetical protein
MKKLIPLFLALLVLISLSACKGSDGKNPAGAPGSAESGGTQDSEDLKPREAQSMPTLLNQTEYVLYQNTFFNNMADDYLGKTFTKEGTFTRLYDAFSEKTRYYVWGYMDATKCCDWQWEFLPKDPDSLPANGSLVRMTGTMLRDDAALDKIWFTDASVELLTAYQPAACEVDMTTMDATLERVQLLNMQYKPDYFQGKTLRFYGRVFQLDSIQHPYYDNSWTQKLSGGTALPAIGTMVVVSGSWKDNAVQVTDVTPSSVY